MHLYNNNNRSEPVEVEEKQSVRHCSRFAAKKGPKSSKIDEIASILPHVYGTTYETLKIKQILQQKLQKLLYRQHFVTNLKLYF